MKRIIALFAFALALGFAPVASAQYAEPYQGYEFKCEMEDQNGITQEIVLPDEMKAWIANAESFEGIAHLPLILLFTNDTVNAAVNFFHVATNEAQTADAVRRFAEVDLNTAFAKSNMKVVMHVVYEAKISGYPDSQNSFEAYAQLINDPQVLALRQQYGQPLVALVRGLTGGAGGVQHAVSGFNVGNFVHELGHALDMNHDPASAQRPNPCTEEPVCRSYGHIWQIPSGITRGDAMSIGAQEGLLQYANPDIKDEFGIPTGKVGVSEAAKVGDIVAHQIAATLPEPVAESDCVSDGIHICLQNRFVITVYYKSVNGGEGFAHTLPYKSEGVPQTEAPQSGLAWFFSAGNLELIFKVLDGCGLNNKYWVFIGALTNVDVEVDVYDTKSGLKWGYRKLEGPGFPPVQDTSAFSCN